MLKSAYVYITTWAGMSIGAFHYYVSLWCGGQRTDIKHKLKDEEVRELNAMEYRRNPAMIFKYEIGDEYSGFWTESEAVDQAIQYFNDNIIDYDFLLKGSPLSASVHECLWAKTELLKDAINWRYNHAKQIGFYDCEEDEKADMDQIDKDYRNIILFGKI